MTNRPRLYPGHQHSWADLRNPALATLVRCTVCGLQMPRNAAGLDDPLRGLRCQFTDAPHGPVQQCQRDAGHEGDHDYGAAAGLDGQMTVHVDHPYTDPGDGRTECETCGKWVWLITHSCKRVPVTEAAMARWQAAHPPPEQEPT